MVSANALVRLALLATHFSKLLMAAGELLFPLASHTLVTQAPRMFQESLLLRCDCFRVASHRVTMLGTAPLQFVHLRQGGLVLGLPVAHIAEPLHVLILPMVKIAPHV